jgi:hypothetical protein
MTDSAPAPIPVPATVAADNARLAARAARLKQLPPWAAELMTLYESDAGSQFILYGNVGDRLLLPPSAGGGLGSLTDYLAKVLMPRFDVVMTYDLGNGIRVLTGNDVLREWPNWNDQPLPRLPRAAVEWLTHYLRYTSNLTKLGHRRQQVGVIVLAANLVVPPDQGGVNHELSALVLQLRDWASDGLLGDHASATFLVTDNLNDLHPLLATNPRANAVKLPLPTVDEIAGALTILQAENPVPAGSAPGALTIPQTAAMLAGATLSAIESLLKTAVYRGAGLGQTEVAAMKKRLVEQDCNGLIEFIQPIRTLDDLYGMEAAKTWLRQDLALWRQGETQAMPMGYLICGPVGTGKTYLVECLAGEANVPVVKLKNFRDKWVGSSEGNLERIFRLVHALGRCYLFVDEADQALGRRDSGGDDGGIGGRLYAMLAAEMSDPRNRGQIVWILASSRPDLIEVDLKRPGRVDVKIPILPTATPAEGWALLRNLAKRRGMVLPADPPAGVVAPDCLTPGAAEALALRIFRLHKTGNLDPVAATAQALVGYRPPVAPAIMQAQIALAVAESTDPAFVPEVFRP